MQHLSLMETVVQMAKDKGHCCSHIYLGGLERGPSAEERSIEQRSWSYYERMSLKPIIITVEHKGLLTVCCTTL